MHKEENIKISILQFIEECSTGWLLVEYQYVYNHKRHK